MHLEIKVSIQVHRKFPYRWSIVKIKSTINAYRDHTMTDDYAPIMGVDRHRIETDGEGITTLVAFYGCPLKCKYCLNPECHKAESNWMSPKALYDLVKVDEIYFRASNGGITFGGGEPLLYPKYISEFAQLCNDRWRINIETSLNVPLESVKDCISRVNTLFVDLKCLKNSKYISYTGKSNRKVLRNLQWLADNGYANSVVIRIPSIEGFTNDVDIEYAKTYCSSTGFINIDIFKYVLPSEFDCEREKRISLGKDICAALKEMRLKVATDNGLHLSSPECTYDGPCKGTCPRCDAELQNITTYIHILENHNIEIKL